MPDPKTGSASKKPSVNFTDWAWSQEILQGPKLVLLALARHADANGCCYPGQERLAEMAGMGDRAIRRHLEWLDEAGLISREHRYRNRRRTSDYYRLRIAGDPIEAADTDPDLNGGKLPVDLTGSDAVPVDVTGTLPVDLAPLPVDLAAVPVTSTGNSNKEVELLQRRTSPEGTSPEHAHPRAPFVDTKIETGGVDQGMLPLGPVSVVDPPQPSPKSKKAATRKRASSRSLDAHGLIAKQIVDEWWKRQTHPPASARFWPIIKIVEGHVKIGCWTPDKIARAMDDVIASGWSISSTTLENALRGGAKVVQMSSRANAGGWQAYRDPEDESIYGYSSVSGSQPASGQ